MSTQNPQPTRQGPSEKVRDLPGCIKYILLFFLILLLLAEIYSGEFRKFPDWGWIIWVILLVKLFLIALLIWLIKVQRDLKCEITDPKNCAKEEIDSNGNPVVIVKGTASGAVFGHYTLDVYDSTTALIPNVVSYPGGGASGTAPVVNNELGRIDTSDFDPGMYKVVLTVFPVGAGATKTCQSFFDLLKAAVWIDKIGHVAARDAGPYSADPAERIKLIGTPETSVGGSISVEGGAYVHGCGKRTSEYGLEFLETAYGNPIMPEPPEPDAVGAWAPVIPPLPYGDPAHPYWWNCVFMHIPNYITNGYLTRFWTTSQCWASPPPPRPYTAQTSWNTLAPNLNGRYIVRVHEKHKPIGMPGPIEDLYDAATVWLDNRQIVVNIRKLKITGGGSLDVCQELSLSAFLPSGKADIIGHAWDPIILDPPTVAANATPNDNFGSYSLQVKKDGGGYVPIPIGPAPIASNVRAPNLLQVATPPQVDTDVLTVWKIVLFLDAGNAPSPYVPPPYPKIYRGERCAYNIHLHATDTTVVNDGTTHNNDDDFPFCIVNDLSKDLPFPAV
ncbi:MAG TPA: hypothetical protein VHE60_07540 [Pyrinomonadaceae bacterium]|nr:hypothetical protein [Pyrinomonadaceae bacterium]